MFYKYTMGFISRIMQLWCAVQEDYIKAVDKPDVDAEYIEQIARNIFRQEDIETMRESIDRNPLFSAKENAVRHIHPSWRRLYMTVSAGTCLNVETVPTGTK